VLLMNNNTTLDSHTGHHAFSGPSGTASSHNQPQWVRPRTEFDGYLIGLAAKAILVPIAIGALFGLWMDSLLSQAYDWTFAFGVLGFVVGSIHARHRLVREEAMLLEEQEIDD